MADSPKGGTILQDNDGNYYYFRDEVLDGYKVTDPDDIAACAELLGGDDVEGFNWQQQQHSAQQNLATPQAGIPVPAGMQLSPIGLGFSAMRVQGLGFRTAC